MADRLRVFFPIETLNRELDYRLYLAALWANSDTIFFIGHHDAIYRAAKTGTGGLYFGQTLLGTVPLNLGRYRTLKGNGIGHMYLQEEGGVYPGREALWRWHLDYQLDPHVLDRNDTVCVWGTFQQQHYKALDPPCSDRIFVTGHPRFDLYKPAYRAYFDDDAERLRGRLGRFVLFSMSFGLANNALGLEDSFSLRNGYDVQNPESRLHAVGEWAFESRSLANFIALIHRVHEELPNHTLVVRPHPSDDWSYYHVVLRGLERVAILHEGPIGPWLLAAETLVHGGCTTALEAQLADRPVVTYLDPDEGFQLYLPSRIGVRCTTQDEAVSAIVEGTTRGALSEELDPLSLSLLSNLSGDSVKATGRVFEALVGEQSMKPQRSAALQIAREARRTELLGRAKAIVRPWFPAKERQYRYGRTKFPGFSAVDTDGKLKRIRALTDRPIQWTFHSHDLLSLVVER